MPDDTPVLRLRKNEERRLKAGHDWIYANEVDSGEVAVKDLPAGAAARVEDARGKALGRALLSPNSLIVGRLYSRDPRQEPTRSFFKKRIEQALSLRQTLFAQPSYRLIHAEADGLPGLVVDRYDDTLVLQVSTAGMEAHLETLVSALDAVLTPTNIVVRNEAGVRGLENLPLYTKALKGEVPEAVTLSENGARFTAPLREGQKIGWFFDHRSARARMAPLARDARVLDVYAYCGGWGVQAAVAGAREVTGVDSSGLALDYMHRNAELNGVGDRLRTLEGDASEAMKALIADGEKFDLVILDPPAFIKRRKDFKSGLAGYHAINELAVRLVQPGGYLVSASCSMHLGADKLLDVMRASAHHIDRALQVIGRDGQGPDHPIQPAMPETAYLKSWFGRVLFRF